MYQKNTDINHKNRIGLKKEKILIPRSSHGPGVQVCATLGWTQPATPNPTPKTVAHYNGRQLRCVRYQHTFELRIFYLQENSFVCHNTNADSSSTKMRHKGMLVTIIC